MKKRVVFEYALTSETDKEAVICITADVYIPGAIERESDSEVDIINAHFVDSHGNAMASISAPDDMPEYILQDWKEIAVETALALKNYKDEDEY
jgi:hypothetical protein